MRKKKILSMLLASVMIIPMVGCGGKGGQSNSGDVVTLRWIVPGDAQTDLASVMEEANKILEPEIGVNLDMQYIDQASFSERMKMLMASGDDFDLCFTGYVNSYATAVDNGGLMDITDLIDQVDGFRDIAPDYVWDMATYKGKIYGVPNIQIMATANAVVVFSDIAKKYDFDWSSVKHIDDIEPYLEMIKKNEPDIYPYRPNFGIIPWYETKWSTVGCRMIAIPRAAETTDEMCYIWETEEWQHGIKQLWSWYQKGYIRKDALSVGDDITDYNNGKYSTAMQVWKPGAEVDEKSSSGLDNSFVLVDKPFMTKDKGTATMISVGAKCKNPIKALELIKLMNTNEELYNLICFGIEGKHYNMANDRVHFIEGSGYNNLGMSWKFGNTFNSLLVEGQADDVWEETQKVNEEAEKSTLMAFTFDNASVKTEISNIATVLSEYEVMNKGVKDPDTYLDEFISKLKKAGIEKVYDETKKQLDDYFAQRK